VDPAVVLHLFSQYKLNIRVLFNMMNCLIYNLREQREDARSSPKRKI
jgi:hypothetical protein